MRWFTLLVVAVSVHAGCKLPVPPDEPSGLTLPVDKGYGIRVNGTMTAAADSSPIPDARVTAYVFHDRWGDYSQHSTGTDGQGRYTLSFHIERGCEGISLRAAAPGFQERWISFDDPHHVRCTSDIQTFNIQLEAEGTGASHGT